MRLTISDARAHLGEICTLAQDPREQFVLTRHGKAIAAIVSIDEVKRIWELQDRDQRGIRNPLSGMFGNCLLPGFVSGLNGEPVTHREAALQMQEVQLSRAAERGILAAGGLEPVEGGELGVMVPAPKRRWWAFWRKREGR